MKKSWNDLNSLWIPTPSSNQRHSSTLVFQWPDQCSVFISLLWNGLDSWVFLTLYMFYVNWEMSVFASLVTVQFLPTDDPSERHLRFPWFIYQTAPRGMTLRTRLEGWVQVSHDKATWTKGPCTCDFTQREIMNFLSPCKWPCARVNSEATLWHGPGNLFSSGTWGF